MTRADVAVFPAVVAATLLAVLPARADSQMHQSPLLERGSPEACDTLRQGRVQRGGYSWRYSCTDIGRGDGRGDRRGH